MLRISSSQHAFKGVIARSSLTRSIPLTYKRSLTSQSQTTIKEEEPVTIYTGPLANVAKKLKLFSITSLGLGTGISPFVFAIDVPVPFVAKAALVGAGKFFFQLSKEKMFCIEKTNSNFFLAVVTSAASTGLIQWVMSPYVTKITIPKAVKENELPEQLTIHTLSFTAKDHATTVPLDNIEPASRIFTSWMINDLEVAKGCIGQKEAKPKGLLYIHPELCEEEGSVMKNIVEKTGIGRGF